MGPKIFTMLKFYSKNFTFSQVGQDDYSFVDMYPKLLRNTLGTLMVSTHFIHHKHRRDEDSISYKSILL